MKYAWLAASLLVFAAPATADSTQLETDPAASWKHQWTSLQMPAQLDGFARMRVDDFADKQLDIAGTYNDAETKTLATLYVFRAGLIDVSVWGDRIAQVIRSNSALGTYDEVSSAATSFTPASGDGTGSGYTMAGSVSGTGLSATGFTMFPHNGWLVAVRMSSGTLTAAQLRARLTSFTAAIPLDPARIEYPQTRAVPDCADSLEFKKQAKQGKPDMTGLLLMGTLGATLRTPTGDDGKPLAKVPATNYCRDKNSTTQYGVYRADGDKKGYVIAIGDAGVAIYVGLSDFGALTGGKSSYWATLLTTEGSRTYAPFNTLPSPQQVIDAVNSEAPVTSTVETPDGKSTVNLPATS